MGNDELLCKMGTTRVLLLRIRKMQLKHLGYFEESGLRESDTHRPHKTKGTERSIV